MPASARRDHLYAAADPVDVDTADPADAAETDRGGTETADTSGTGNTPPPRRPARATVTPCTDGPTLVQGATTVVDPAGQSHDTWRPVAAVCRCAKSSLLPWCDGTHKVLRKAWRPEVEATAHAGGRVVLTATTEAATGK